MDPHDANHQNESDGDATEWKMVAEMRAIVEAQDPASKEEDNLMLRRFLRARDQNVEKASAMFLKYLKWKRVAIPNGFISDAEVANELSQEKLYMQGLDKTGCPIVVVFGAKHYSSRRDLEEFKYLKGWGYSNCDIRAYLAALDIMQNYYPERLGKVFLIHVPYVFMTAWKIVYPFIDSNTKKKFVFVEDKDLHATLREDIDESQLPEMYGGRLQMTSIAN